jgi:hypothetical protein
MFGLHNHITLCFTSFVYFVGLGSKYILIVRGFARVVSLLYSVAQAIGQYHGKLGVIGWNSGGSCQFGNMYK